MIVWIALMALIAVAVFWHGRRTKDRELMIFGPSFVVFITLLIVLTWRPF